MSRVEKKQNWTLFSPDEAPGLCEVWGKDFENLYIQYENEGRGRKVMKAQELWKAITISQIETGTPYICFKDASNEKSNQRNLGTIKGSNLCCEIMQYHSPEEIAVCNLVRDRHLNRN